MTPVALAWFTFDVCSKGCGTSTLVIIQMLGVGVFGVGWSGLDWWWLAVGGLVCYAGDVRLQVGMYDTRRSFLTLEVIPLRGRSVRRGLERGGLVVLGGGGDWLVMLAMYAYKWNV